MACSSNASAYPIFREGMDARLATFGTATDFTITHERNERSGRWWMVVVTPTRFRGASEAEGPTDGK